MSVFKTTADKLQRAIEDLSATKLAISELRAEREALLEDGAADAFTKLDNRIADRERQADVFRQRIPLLQRRLDDERRAGARARREAAIAEAEKILPVRMRVVEALAVWAKEGAVLVDKLQSTSKLKGWPDDLERPYASNVNNGQFLSALGRALSDLGGDWNPAQAIAIIDDAVQIQIENQAQAVDDLRLALQSEPKEDVAA